MNLQTGSFNSFNSSLSNPNHHNSINNFSMNSNPLSHLRWPTQSKNNDLDNQQESIHKNLQQQNSSILLALELQDGDTNEDVCFKCKKYGEIYCCDNCFRSYHWGCISPKKIDELSKDTYPQHFRCQYCDYDKICSKCNSKFPKIKSNSNDLSGSKSISSYYKCSYCYSKVHKKCIDIPLEKLQRKKQKSSGQFNNKNLDQNQQFENFFCTNCLQNFGITQIIKSQRVEHSFGIEKLYFLVLLKTKSPIHKGWFQEIVLSRHLSKLNGEPAIISQFIQNPQLYNNPEIDKIIMVKLPIKYRKLSFNEFQKIIQTKKDTITSQNYGHPDNFKFLVKWKHRDYSCLTWQDQSIVLKNPQKIKQYISQKQRQLRIQQLITKREVPSKKSSNLEQYFKIAEHYLSQQPKIRQKYLQKNLKIQIPNTLDYKQPEQKIIDLDSQYSKQPFIEMILFQSQAQQSKMHENNFSHIHVITKYLKKCYKKNLILRPTMILTSEPQKWIKQIQNYHYSKQHQLKYVFFTGNKVNTTIIKKIDFFSFKNPPLFKFDLLILDQNYFQHQKQFIYKQIPAFYNVIFDIFYNPCEIDNRINFIQKFHVPFKSKIQKEIYLVDIKAKQKISEIAKKLITINMVKSYIKKVVCHPLNFIKPEVYTLQQPKLKIIIQRKYAQSLKSLLPQNQVLNEGQRLSFLNYILTYGLNQKGFDQIIQKLKNLNPSIWNEEKQQQKVQEQQPQGQQKNQSRKKSILLSIKDYLPRFISIIWKNGKQQSHQTSNLQNINHYLFGFKSETVLKRIIQLKTLKNQIEKNITDHSKFPVSRPFSFFSSGQLKKFPLWNTYQDYTLGALIVEQGYERWTQIINSTKWRKFHCQLQTRKIYQFNGKNGNFIIKEQIVPIKSKNPGPNNSQTNNSNGISTIKNLNNMNLTHIISQNDQNHEFQAENESFETYPETYGQYLIKKIYNSKEFKQIQYQRLLEMNVLTDHIAERGQFILMSMNSK